MTIFPFCKFHCKSYDTQALPLGIDDCNRGRSFSADVNLAVVDTASIEQLARQKRLHASQEKDELLRLRSEIANMRRQTHHQAETIGQLHTRVAELKTHNAKNRANANATQIRASVELTTAGLVRADKQTKRVTHCYNIILILYVTHITVRGPSLL